MKVSAWYIDPNGIENKNTIKYSYPIGIKKYEILIVDAQNGIEKERILDQH